MIKILSCFGLNVDEILDVIFENGCGCVGVVLSVIELIRFVFELNLVEEILEYFLFFCLIVLLLSKEVFCLFIGCKCFFIGLIVVRKVFFFLCDIGEGVVFFILIKKLKIFFIFVFDVILICFL